MDWNSISISIIVTMFISKRAPMNFNGNQKKSYGRVPMISGNGTAKFFTTRSEILGLVLKKQLGFCDIQNNQGWGKCYQPKPMAEADNTNRALDYSGYHKNRI